MPFTIAGMGTIVDYVKETQARYDNVEHYRFVKDSHAVLHNERDLFVFPLREKHSLTSPWKW